VKVDDRLLLPLLQPKVLGNPAAVLVNATVAFSPIVEFAAISQRRSSRTSMTLGRSLSRCARCALTSIPSVPRSRRFTRRKSASYSAAVKTRDGMQAILGNEF
jgi:hypothetical protein